MNDEKNGTCVVRSHLFTFLGFPRLTTCQNDIISTTVGWCKKMLKPDTGFRPMWMYDDRQGRAGGSWLARSHRISGKRPDHRQTNSSIAISSCPVSTVHNKFKVYLDCLLMILVAGQALVQSTRKVTSIPLARITCSRLILVNHLGRSFFSHQNHLSNATKRNSSSKNRSGDNSTNGDARTTPQEDLKWTEKEEAPKWMQKMAPYKGGTKLPNKVEGTIIFIVTVLGLYSWFVDPGSFLVDSKSSNDSSAPARRTMEETRQG